MRSGDPHIIGRRIRRFCRYGLRGIADPPDDGVPQPITPGVPRPIIPGDIRILNKRIVEALSNLVYTMALDKAAGERILSCCRSA